MASRRCLVWAAAAGGLSQCCVAPRAAEAGPYRARPREGVISVVHTAQWGDAAWAALRAGSLLWFQVLPFLWACVLHLVSARLVSRGALHDLALGFFSNSGPCFMKLGQWAASRRDIFSDEFCDLVGQLHSACPSHPWRDTRARLQEEYGNAFLGDVFDTVEEAPLHSGCIAQIHRATVKHDPRPMVIKVLHPNVEHWVRVDLRILSWGVKVLTSLLPGAEWLSLREAFEEFEAHMKLQVDLRLEAANLATFQKYFAGDADVTFPTPVLPLARPAAIVETYEAGTPVSDFLTQEKDETTRRSVAMQGCKAFFKMIFDDNFFHTDLHPGNILVQKTAEGTRLVIVDAGLVAKLDAADRKNFIELFAAVCAGDGRLAADLILKGAKRQECADPERFRQGMTRIIDKVSVNRKKAFKLSDVDIGEVLLDALSVARTNRVKLDPDFTNVVVSIVLLEGIGRGLYPDLNLFNVAIPFLLPMVKLSDVKQLAPVIMEQYF